METAIVVLFAPAGLLLLASISLFQFTTLWRAFAAAVSSKSGSAAWKTVQPALKQLEIILENALGSSPSSFKTNATVRGSAHAKRHARAPDASLASAAPPAQHCLLVAVILAVLIAGERIRSAPRR
jgi:hypothetical protein